MQQPIETHDARTLSAMLDGIAGSLRTDAERAATGASEALDAVPGQPQALFLLIAALKLMGIESGVPDLLRSMSQDFPKLASLHYALGVLLGRLGKSQESIAHLSRAVALEPNHQAAWRVLGDALARAGDRAGAGKAYARHSLLSIRELKLVEDVMQGGPEDLAKAEKMLGQALAVNPTDVSAMSMLGDVFFALGRFREANEILARALEMAPCFTAARALYATLLNRQMDWRTSNTELEIVLAQDPGSRLRTLYATNLLMLGEHDRAYRIFEEGWPGAEKDKIFWLNYGHAARTTAKDDDTIVGAYRKSIALDPSYGVAWWGLADLKTYRLSPDDVSAMRQQLERPDISDGDRCHIEFALGKAFEDAGDYAESFEHYRRGNALRRAYISYSADTVHREMESLKRFYTRDFFASHEGSGSPSRAPIFIVGMARAGSTLVEQILASHSQVEGTAELPDMGNIVAELIRTHGGEKAFPSLLSNYGATDFARFGEDYLERTSHQRKLGRLYFTDKSGPNFHHIGLIRLILPNAKIVDARRHPLACGFSCFKQAFALGALHFAYDQADIGRYYRDYVELMAHYDEVLPGRIYRVMHEDLVKDPEREIRRLLAYCDLPFEEQCLRSHESDRGVRTSSSQQVRQPIRRKAVEVWQHYEAWLEPMKDALGDVLTRYPEVPEFG